MNTLDEVKLYIDRNKKLQSDFSEYSKMYLFTTENIKEYLNKYDLQDKKVLTVCGSGDQLLNAYLLGAKDVVCFDVNKLSYYLLMLKINAIRNLKFNEFMTFFIQDNNSYFFYKNIYKIMRISLDQDVQDFFDYVFYTFSNEEAYSKFFYSFNINRNRMSKVNCYFDQYHYEKLSEIMKVKNPTFIYSNIKDLKMKLEDTYDVMLFSNISDYITDLFTNSFIDYRNLIIDLTNFLNSDGIIQAGYIYNYRKKDNNQVLASKQKRKDIFKFPNNLIFNELEVDGFEPFSKDLVLSVRKK